MSSEVKNNLTIARLTLRKGDPFEARAIAQESLYLISKEHDSENWLEAARLHFQCCQELNEIEAAASVMDQTCSLLQKGSSEIVQAQAETLIASWLLAQGKIDESNGYLESAIHKATRLQDLNTLARALVIKTLSLCQKPETYSKALSQLEKLTLISDGIENPETLITAQVLKGYLLTQLSQHNEALNTLWKAYENAKLHGYLLIISSIIAQIARVYKAQGSTEQYRLYANLAIKGTSAEKTPRLHEQIKKLCPEDIKINALTFDFQVDEKSHLMVEKNIGAIDFKNQHILYDLALMFLKNPGHRFSKADLVKYIWHQKYDPTLHDNLIYVSIKRLRTLLEPDLESPKYVLRDRKGYYFNPASSINFKMTDEVNL